MMLFSAHVCLVVFAMCRCWASGLISDSKASAQQIGSESLVDSFLDKELMEKVVNYLLPQCAKDEDEDNIGGSSLSCNQVKYLAEVKEYYRHFQPKEGKEGIVRNAPTILDKTKDSGAEISQYIDVFEELVVKKVPFKGTMEKGDVKYKLPLCANVDINPFTFDKSLSACDGVHTESEFAADKSVFVPMIAVNSYYNKVPPRPMSSGGNFDIDLSSHWPSLVEIGKGVIPTHSCPFGGHMVIWNPTPSKVSVQLVHSTDGSKLGNLFNGEKSHLHFPYFSNIMENDAQINYAEVLLGQNEYLFAPNNLLVNFNSRIEAGERPEKVALLRSCFVDASNLNVFRHAISGPAHLYEHWANLQSVVDDVTFNVTMDATPKDTSLRDIRSQQRLILEKFVGGQLSSTAPRTDIESNSSESSDQDKADEQDSDVAGRTRERKGGGRSRRDRKARNTNIKGWVDSKKWRSLIEALTLPPATAPVVKSMKSRGVTIEWTSPYIPRKGDESNFAFELSFCEQKQIDSVSVSNGSTCQPIIINLDSLSLQKRVEGRVTAEDEGKTFFSYSMRDLSPGYLYLYRLTYTFGDIKAKASKWVSLETPHLSVPLVTPEMPFRMHETEDCTSIRLSIPAIDQEGESNTIGYYVFTRSGSYADQESKLRAGKFTQNAGLASDWLFHDKVLVKTTDSSSKEKKEKAGQQDVYHDVEILGLMPDTIYEFKVSPYNEVGQAKSLSHSTEPIEIACTSRKTPESIVYAGAKEASDHVHLLTLNDTAQTLTCSDNQLSIVSAWSSHWSSKSFTLIGQTSYVVPLLLETAVQNTQSITNKIAIVGRGSIPLVNKVMKLQLAGAKGVIILDSGECKEYDQECMPGADKKKGQGWAASDMPEPWASVKIPVVFILRGEEAKLGKCLGHPTYRIPTVKSEL